MIWLLAIIAILLLLLILEVGAGFTRLQKTMIAASDLNLEALTRLLDKIR